MERSIRTTTTCAGSISEARIIAPTIGRALRESAGLSLSDVARSVGVTRQCVWSWEAGISRPSGIRAERYLGVLKDLEGLLP